APGGGLGGGAARALGRPRFAAARAPRGAGALRARRRMSSARRLGVPRRATVQAGPGGVPVTVGRPRGDAVNQAWGGGAPGGAGRWRAGGGGGSRCGGDISSWF